MRQPERDTKFGPLVLQCGDTMFSMEFTEAVAKAIAAERAISGMTVRELSAASGIPVSTLMRIIKAERDIKVDQLAKLGAAMGVDPASFLTRAGEIAARDERPAEPDFYALAANHATGSAEGDELNALD